MFRFVLAIATGRARSELGALFLERQFHVAAHIQRFVELRLLGQKADLGPLVRLRFALELLVEAGHDLQQR